MQSPLVVGIASIIPGLGFVLLDRIRWAANAFFIVTGLFVAGLLVPTLFWSDMLTEFSIMAWIGQIYYAVQTAITIRKQESGEMAAPREASPLASMPADLSRGERLAFKSAELVRQQLPPGEVLKEAIFGQILPSEGKKILGGTLTALSIKQYYVGITNHGLALLGLDMLGKPVSFEQIPARFVQSIQYKKQFLNDDLAINLKEGKALKFQVNYLLRKHTENMSALFTEST